MGRGGKITRWLHGMASNLEGRTSEGLEKRMAGGNGGSGAGEATGGDLGEAVAPLGSGGKGVNEGNH
jgi:hypothetical protein